MSEFPEDSDFSFGGALPSDLWFREIPDPLPNDPPQLTGNNVPPAGSNSHHSHFDAPHFPLPSLFPHLPPLVRRSTPLPPRPDPRRFHPFPRHSYSHSPSSSSSEGSESESNQDAQTLSDDDDDSESLGEEEETQDSQRVRPGRSTPSQRESGEFVDLTGDTSPWPDMPSSGERASKRRRVADDTSGQGSPRKKRVTNKGGGQNAAIPAVEEVDLRDVDDDQGLSKVLEDQRMATIKAQQEQAAIPVKLATLQCIICMDAMKDVTATSCGHLFCHSCLMEALIAGENQGSEPGKGPSKCPVCRKRVKRPTGNSRKDAGQIVALEIKIRKPASARATFKK